MDITPNRIRLSREQWDVLELGRLPLGHKVPAYPSAPLDGPIVVVEYQCSIRPLDGNHRINTWLARGDAELHPVHIRTVEGVARLIETPR